MARILALVHRTPYPPNKGDKIRSWNLIQHLMSRHDVYLGFYEDSADDRVHRAFLAEKSVDMRVVHVSPLAQKILSLRGLLSGEAQSVAAYPKKKLKDFVADLIAQKKIDAIFLYSGITASLLPPDLNIPVILDMVDVDSAKWQAYGEKAPWPLSVLYKREAVRLANFEKKAAEKSNITLFVSEAEAALFRERSNVSGPKIIGLSNGVDLAHFSQRKQRFFKENDKPVLIFTGAMTYPPNIEAVRFFARQVLPGLQARFNGLEFVIAGSPVAPDVERLGRLKGVRVTGFVRDMRDELEAATLAVAPLFTARGIQNKVLEAMAMGLPVLATKNAAEGIWPLARGQGETPPLLIADTAEDMVAAITKNLLDPAAQKAIGQRARNFVEKNFSWEQHCSKFDTLLKELGVH